jgi:predicted nucleic acid-binding protein
MTIGEDFVSRFELLNYGFAAAAHYGQIQATLERGGTPIGVNDCHIGPHARSLRGLGAVILTALPPDSTMIHDERNTTR